MKPLVHQRLAASVLGQQAERTATITTPGTVVPYTISFAGGITDWQNLEAEELTQVQLGQDSVDGNIFGGGEDVYIGTGDITVVNTGGIFSPDIVVAVNGDRVRLSPGDLHTFPGEAAPAFKEPSFSGDVPSEVNVGEPFTAIITLRCSLFPLGDCEDGPVTISGGGREAFRQDTVHIGGGARESFEGQFTFNTAGAQTIQFRVGDRAKRQTVDVVSPAAPADIEVMPTIDIRVV